MAFGSLLSVPKDKLVQIEKAKATPKKRATLLERGCEYCPQSKTKGIEPIFNKVRGKKILIFTTAPGPKENEEGETLAGSSGDFLWDELEKVGISSKDCDIQNTVRCYPADRKNGMLYKRDPSKEEIHCCSLYTEKALEKSEAKIYILLGALTHKTVLGKEYKKSKRIFWSEKLQAKVYCLAHPNYFLGGHAPQIALDEFRDALKAINQDLDGKKISQYAYIEKQDYQAIRTISDIKRVERILNRAAQKGIRITVDIEHDIINGKKLFLCCGFTYKVGQSFVCVLDHPKARKINGKWKPLSNRVRRYMHKVVSRILQNIIIRKAFHQGSSDVPFIQSYSGLKVKGYDYDTIYAEFLAHPDRRAYGLAVVALQRYPQFGDYKTIILPECIPPGTDMEKHTGKDKIDFTELDKTYQYVGRSDLMHFSYLPLKKLVLRNGADTDITKRIELSTKKKVNLALLRIYRDAAFVLAEMEPNGPEFDNEHCEKLKRLYPPRFEIVRDKLQMISGRDDFNPGSPPQVKELLYKKLKIKPPDVAYDKKKKKKRDEDGNVLPQEPGTGKAVLEVLSRKYEVARLIQDFRKLGKIISTYITAYETNAKLNNGRLKTKWWLTGTQTGRLSSGGDKQVKEVKNQNINLQNIHGDNNLQNLATADKDWRKLYKAINRAASKIVQADLTKLQITITKLQSTENKDKQKELSNELYAQVSRIKLKLYNSNRFKKLCTRIIEKYGDVRVLLGFDQGQIEVRVMAQASGDKNLIKDCMSTDIHSKVGHAMTGWGVEKIKKDKKTRTLTKNIHFGILFGLSANGLMEFIKLKDPDSTITEEEAQRLYDNYFKAYPGVRIFIERMRTFVEKHGYVENMFGFRRPLSSGSIIDGYEKEEGDDDQVGGAYWGNQAINTPVQGAAHQLMLSAIAVLKRKRKKYKKIGVPTLEIHDYIGFKTKLKDLLAAYHLCKELLEKEPLEVVKKEFPLINWLIPLVVEGKVGFRLGDSVDCEDDGKLKHMHEIMADMFLETLTKELKLDADLRKAA